MIMICAEVDIKNDTYPYSFCKECMYRYSFDSTHIQGDVQFFGRPQTTKGLATHGIYASDADYRPCCVGNAYAYHNYVKEYVPCRKKKTS